MRPRTSFLFSLLASGMLALQGCEQSAAEKSRLEREAFGDFCAEQQYHPPDVFTTEQDIQVPTTPYGGTYASWTGNITAENLTEGAEIYTTDGDIRIDGDVGRDTTISSMWGNIFVSGNVANGAVLHTVRGAIEIQGDTDSFSYIETIHGPIVIHGNNRGRVTSGSGTLNGEKPSRWTSFQETDPRGEFAQRFCRRLHYIAAGTDM